MSQLLKAVLKAVQTFKPESDKTSDDNEDLLIIQTDHLLPIKAIKLRPLSLWSEGMFIAQNNAESIFSMLLYVYTLHTDIVGT